ncbi:hypothetical protein X975_18976, partial [Stegodyphus mimosarum]
MNEYQNFIENSYFPALSSKPIRSATLFTLQVKLHQHQKGI